VRVRAVDLLDRAGDRGDGGGAVPQARAARGGRQGARLLQEHQRHGVSQHAQRRMKLLKLAAHVAVGQASGIPAPFPLHTHKLIIQSLPYP